MPDQGTRRSSEEDVTIRSRNASRMVPGADIVHTSRVTSDLRARTTRTQSLGRLRNAAVFLLIFCALPATLGVAAWGFYRFWPRKLVIRTGSATPIPTWQGARLRLISPTGYLLSEVGRYGDELTAYLYFEYLRSLKAVDSSRSCSRPANSHRAPFTASTWHWIATC